MSWWNAKYKNNHGEYEITFASKDYEKAKAVEKVCCAIIDKNVKSPFDVEVVVRCRECKHCDSTIFNGNFIGFCKIRKDSYGAKLRVGLSDYCSDGERKEGAE